MEVSYQLLPPITFTCRREKTPAPIIQWLGGHQSCSECGIRKSSNWISYKGGIQILARCNACKWKWYSTLQNTWILKSNQFNCFLSNFNLYLSDLGTLNFINPHHCDSHGSGLASQILWKVGMESICVTVHCILFHCHIS